MQSEIEWQVFKGSLTFEGKIVTQHVFPSFKDSQMSESFFKFENWTSYAWKWSNKSILKSEYVVQCAGMIHPKDEGGQDTDVGRQATVGLTIGS